ncbi:hypothetical protein BDV96DRAFT_605042 [Lophiotrema nucula]|uniref:Uncharacterized protein n=1 Tax=Lophiotrema nucula TaxID=690887 RepID=A0A6A5YT57_9PLEO|nr:hypothetical protein BDV96DRAFT_605042 [Lophiotrema nucula]
MLRSCGLPNYYASELRREYPQTLSCVLKGGQSFSTDMGGGDSGQGCLRTAVLHGTDRSMPAVWCSIRVGDDAVLFGGLVDAGRRKPCRVFGLGRRTRVAVSRLDGCYCVRWTRRIRSLLVGFRAFPALAATVSWTRADSLLRSLRAGHFSILAYLY